MAGSAIATIVLGYDGSDSSRHALERTGTLAEALGARVVVVGVVPALLEAAAAAASGDPLGPAVALAAPTPDDLAQADSRAVEAQAERLRRPVSFLAAKGIAADSAVLRGDAVDQLLEAAESKSADLIVVGAEDHGLVERLLGGDVGQRVARKAPCDVLIVRPSSDDS